MIRSASSSILPHKLVTPRHTNPTPVSATVELAPRIWLRERGPHGLPKAQHVNRASRR
jgi:hypothetical protein